MPDRGRGLDRPESVLHEGPFGEWTGYYSGPSPSSPLGIRWLYFLRPIILSTPGEASERLLYMRALLNRDDQESSPGRRSRRHGVWYRPAADVC
jgi:hypothetical protein